MLEYFIVFIAFFGVITSYEDIKFGKIRNKWVLWMMISGFTVHLVLMILTFFKGTLNTGYVFEYFVNVLISTVLGVLLWINLIWSAGDAKLFIAYSFIIPNSIYFRDHINYFPSLVLLINTFVPAMIYLFTIGLIRSSYKEKKKTLIDLFRFRMPMMFGFYVGISWVFGGIKSSVTVLQNPFVYLAVIWITFEIFNKSVAKVMELIKINSKYSVFVYVLFAVLRMIFDYERFFSIDFLRNVLLISLLYSLVRSFCFEITKNYFTKEIDIHKVKPGDILDEMLYSEDGKIIKKEIGIRNKNPVFSLGAEGVTKSQIQILREMGGRFSIQKIRIQKSMPFAQILFVGVIITIIAGGVFTGLLY